MIASKHTNLNVALAIAAMAYTTSSGAMCSLLESVQFVEVVVNACEVEDSFEGTPLGHNRGALVTAQVRAETSVPVHPGGYQRYGLDPDEWHIVRSDGASTREYFYLSEDPDICERLIGDTPLLLQQSEPCCDTGPTHPVCIRGRKVLSPLPEQVRSLEQSGGV